MIGAPNQKDGGAIYIYHGAESRDTFDTEPAQVGTNLISNRYRNVGSVNL